MKILSKVIIPAIEHDVLDLACGVVTVYPERRGQNEGSVWSRDMESSVMATILNDAIKTAHRAGYEEGVKAGMYAGARSVQDACKQAGLQLGLDYDVVGS